MKSFKLPDASIGVGIQEGLHSCDFESPQLSAGYMSRINKLEFGTFLTFIPPPRREMLISMTPLFF
jgi:hypothetical protein